MCKVKFSDPVECLNLKKLLIASYPAFDVIEFCHSNNHGKNGIFALKKNQKLV